MTTNSPNPVDGDVQALIKHCECEIEKFKRCVAEYPDAPVLRSDLKLHEIALAALTAPPAQLLRPVELPKETGKMGSDFWLGEMNMRSAFIKAIREAGYEVKS